MSIRLGGIIGCKYKTSSWNLNGFPNGSNIRSTACTYVCMVIAYSKCMDQPGKVANPARGQLNRENGYSPVPVRV